MEIITARCRANGLQAGGTFTRRKGLTEGITGIAGWRRKGLGEKLEATPLLKRLVETGRMSLFVHEEATSTVGDKCRVARLDSTEVLKTWYCKLRRPQRQSPTGKKMGGKVGEETNLPRLVICGVGDARFDIDRIYEQYATQEIKAQGTGMRSAKKLPRSMNKGTCTPILEGDEAGELGLMFLQNPDTKIGEKRLADIEVDVCLGGTNELSMRFSAMVKYGDLVGELQAEHQGKIVFWD